VGQIREENINLSTFLSAPQKQTFSKFLQIQLTIYPWEV
jgi:hypothetical protein